MVDCLLACLLGWLLVWLVAWLVGCLVGWLLVCLFVWLVGCVVSWLLGCLAGCLLGWLLAWLFGRDVLCEVAMDQDVTGRRPLAGTLDLPSPKRAVALTCSLARALGCVHHLVCANDN